MHHSGRGDSQELHEVSYLFPERVYTFTNTTRHMLNMFCIIAFTLKKIITIREACLIIEFNS